MERLKKKPGGWAGFEDYSARARMAGKAMIFTALVGLVIWIVLAVGVTLLKYRLAPPDDSFLGLGEDKGSRLSGSGVISYRELASIFRYRCRETLLL